MSQQGGSSKCFGFVNRYDTKPRRRLFEMLKSQGMQMNQAVTFLSDGGDTVRDLQMYLNPQAEHLLDWFHISMRLTVMGQMAKSINTNDQPNLSAEVKKELERLKWNLWHEMFTRRCKSWTSLAPGFSRLPGLAERSDLDCFHGCSLHGPAGLLALGSKRYVAVPWILVDWIRPSRR
jgi:hypothetical protein